MTNLNEIAKDITLNEGLKDQVKIGNVKEVMRILFTEYSLAEIAKMWMKYNKIKLS